MQTDLVGHFFTIIFVNGPHDAIKFADALFYAQHGAGIRCHIEGIGRQAPEPGTISCLTLSEFKTCFGKRNVIKDALIYRLVMRDRPRAGAQRGGLDQLLSARQAASH